jgi:putative ABC transport system ATP-binding protein
MPVSVKDLAYTYGQGRLLRHVLKGVSFDVDDGEVAIITGPSGSGKTTLLTILGALRSFSQGTVIVNGVSLQGQPTAELLRMRQRIGFVFQRHNLLKSLPVFENVESGLHLLAESDPEMNRARAQAMLKAVGLGDRGHDFPHNMSGGEQQRVAVARALVRMPDLIIADEPTAALDSKSGRLVADLTRDIAGKLGCAVIVATHDERIFDIADSRLHMEDGRLVKLPMGA